MKKYEMEYLISEVKNYYNNESAYFYTYHNCSLSQSLRNGEKLDPYIYDILYKYINKDSVVIEGGSHIGSHTIFISKMCKKLICFESMKQTYELLRKNIELNNCDNVDYYNLGLSDKISKTKYAWIPFGNLGGSGLDNNPYGIPEYSEKLNNIELDEVNLINIDSLNLDRLDFLKLDIEGYEELAIIGGIETIKKYKPYILMEVWSDHYGNHNIDFVIKKFKNLLELGYSVEHCGYANWIFIP